MTRIHAFGVTPDNKVAAISPDGKKAAIVIWRGDIERNTNVFSLLIYDMRKLREQRPDPVLSWDFPGDPEEQFTSPIAHIRFLQDNRTVSFLGRKDGAQAQVYTVDVYTRELRQLTDHPSAVRSYVMGDHGKVLAYSAVAPSSEGLATNPLIEDGVFLWDRSVFSRFSKYSLTSPLIRWGEGHPPIRKYFASRGGEFVEFFDSRRNVIPLDHPKAEQTESAGVSLAADYILAAASSLTADNSGRYVVMHPYAEGDHPVDVERYAYYQKSEYARNEFVRRLAAPFGLLDLRTGSLERLIDAPGNVIGNNQGPPLWAPDGSTVLIQTLLPDAPEAMPQWVEVQIGDRSVAAMGLPENWRPLRWSSERELLLEADGGTRFAQVSRSASGEWSDFREIPMPGGFNPAWSVVSNGHWVLGVKDSTYSPPELVATELSSGRSTVLSNFNPRLRGLRYGAVETFVWDNGYQQDASGLLIRPLHYQKGKRYPLVVLFDDGMLNGQVEPYLLDGVGQLSSYAVQVLAAQGFFVLYLREPKLKDVSETPEEGVRMQRHAVTAIEALDRAGLVDSARVGISGWSRAGYYTDFSLIHSGFPFAAAIAIDGGISEYNDGMRPFTDAELSRIRTPKLFQFHGLSALVIASQMISRMEAMGKPLDVLYFHTASHTTERPQHRLRSLGVALDWWRFWLKDEEDQDPAKANQYRHWRQLREMHMQGKPEAGARQTTGAAGVKP